MDADEVAELITFIPSYGRERIRAFLQRLREEAGCLGGHRAEVRGGHQQTSATKSAKALNRCRDICGEASYFC